MRLRFFLPQLLHPLRLNSPQKDPPPFPLPLHREHVFGAHGVPASFLNLGLVGRPGSSSPSGLCFSSSSSLCFVKYILPESLNHLFISMFDELSVVIPSELSTSPTIVFVREVTGSFFAKKFSAPDFILLATESIALQLRNSLKVD